MLAQKNKAAEEEISRLSLVLGQKAQEIAALKEKVGHYERFMREFRNQEHKFKEEVLLGERAINELRQLKANYEDLEDHNMELEANIIKLQTEKADALKEVSNLDKVIAINADELRRVEQHLSELKHELANKKDNEKALFAKVKDSEKRIRAVEGELEKEKGRLTKDRN